MPNAIKYQDTKVPVEQTLSELAGLVKRYGGARFEQGWTPEGRVSEVRFAIRHDTLSELPVRLPARTGRVQAILYEAGLWRSYPRQEREEKIAAQAERISWRHVKDLTEQLLLAVSLDIRSLAEAFLADVEIVDPELGEPVRMAEYLEQRAVAHARGLVLEDAAGSAIPMPPAERG